MKRLVSSVSKESGWCGEPASCQGTAQEPPLKSPYLARPGSAARACAGSPLESNQIRPSTKQECPRLLVYDLSPKGSRASELKDQLGELILDLPEPAPAFVREETSRARVAGIPGG